MDAARLIRRTPGVRHVVRAYQSWTVANSQFFKKYPYRGRLAHHAVDWHTAVDLELGVLFHRIPKAANSSLVASVEALKSGADAVTDQGAKRDLRHTLRQPSQLSKEEVERVEDLIKFVIVRNPYDRVLSAYLSKVKGPEELGPGLKGRPGGAAGAALPKGASFETFCRFLAAGGLYKNGHWAPQTEFLTFGVERYHFVGRLETIATDFPNLARLVKGPGYEAPMAEEDPTHATGAAAKRDRYYTPELYALVYDIYRRDFETLEYPRV